ncbi:hypothetical protein Leryth_009828, partial [Lithospermum erythrorhizon]
RTSPAEKVTLDFLCFVELVILQFIIINLFNEIMFFVAYNFRGIVFSSHLLCVEALLGIVQYR